MYHCLFCEVVQSEGHHLWLTQIFLRLYLTEISQNYNKISILLHFTLVENITNNCVGYIFVESVSQLTMTASFIHVTVGGGKPVAKHRSTACPPSVASFSISSCGA